MNKNILALSVAAAIGGMSGSAMADLKFNPDGVGNILIQPYYTAQNGNDTLINLVNTDTEEGKAVKIRFRSAGNSDDVLDFQIFLSPGDVWTANVSEGEDGRALLTTTDNTCTLPAIPEAGVPFITQNLPAGASDAVKAEWTREGYVEFLNMGDIKKDSDEKSLYTNIKHVNGVAPCDQARLLAINPNPEKDLEAPTTGLAANWIVINVPTAASWGGEATAIEARGAAKVVYYKQDEEKATGNVVLQTADPIIRFVRGEASNFDLPDLSTPYVEGTPEAQAAELSNALAVTSVANEFLTVAGIGAETDWVFSMPTRRYQVAYNYTGEKGVFNGKAGIAGDEGKEAIRVFNDDAGGHFNAANTTVSGNLICVNLGAVTSWDQEERTRTAGAAFSPGTIDKVRFCGEGTVLKFNGSDVLGASVATASISNGYNAGWTLINTANRIGEVDVGIPVLGQSFVKAVNGNVADGVSGNFGAGFKHRVTRPAAAE